MNNLTGLSHKKAKELLKEFGTNEITEKRNSLLFRTFVSQFTSLLVILLIIAAVASIILGEKLDGFFILLIVFFNGILGFFQEFKAEKAIKALKNMTASLTRVLRDGVEQNIDSKFLVKGDILFLSEGDKIPADCRIVDSLHLEVNEASLTGESFPVEKNITDDEKNKLFMGTIVTRGKCVAIVTETGMRTRFGSIAQGLSKIKSDQTPLQKKLGLLSKQLAFMAVLSSAIVIVIGYFSNLDLVEMILTSVSLAVAAVPEGLPAVITITLAVGMERMAKKRAILRKLASIEALGGVSLIATDKTGTLTKNEMRVTKHYLYNNKNLSEMLTVAVICNNASLLYMPDKKRYQVLGDSTEGALLLFAKDNNFDAKSIKPLGKIVEEFAFDPVLKLMSVIYQAYDKISVYSKGAPESILPLCKNLNDDQRSDLEIIYKSYATEGLRVMAVASKEVDKLTLSREANESSLDFIGFVGIEDPPRPEVKDAIELAKEAGIKTIMITGDNELTARAIALKIGLIDNSDKIITGAEFSKLSDQDAVQCVAATKIFARTSPDQKLKIVSLLQHIGHVVAVTGDGVNDALAIKQADVGVAMGITGTDVAKEASDMVITDDNYATLVSAVEEGRIIFDNIKSAIKYLVGCNIGEIIAVLLGMILGWPLILTPLQLLYVNLVTDGLPAVALAATPKHEGIMKRRPRTGNNIFRKLDFAWFLEVGVLTAATTLFAFWIGMRSGSVETARALAFTTLVVVQHFILLDVRVREKSFLKVNLLKDKFFLIAFFLPLIFQLFIIYIPYLENIFKINRLTAVELVIIIAVSSAVLLSGEVRKLYIRLAF